MKLVFYLGILAIVVLIAFLIAMNHGVDIYDKTEQVRDEFNSDEK